MSEFLPEAEGLRPPDDRRAEAANWHRLAAQDLEAGRYRTAREKFGRALETWRQLGDQAGEAATWHGLASLDLEEGDYRGARSHFVNALEIWRQLGDRAGEAAAFFQLGALAARQGRLADGARLVAVCCLIEQGIGHPDTEQDYRQLREIIAELGLRPEQYLVLLREVAEGYERDGGAALIEAAFTGL